MLAKLKQKVDPLVQEGQQLLIKADGFFRLPKLGGADEGRARLVRELIAHYHAWYNASRPLVQANLPEAYMDFTSLYFVETDRANSLGGSTQTLEASVLQDFEKTAARQLGILRSIPDVLEVKAISLRGLLARDLHDSEIAVARELHQNGYVREAGMIAGVALEGHLKYLCEKHGEPIGKTDTIKPLNQKLRRHYPDVSQVARGD